MQYTHALTEPEVDDVLLGAAVALGVRVQQDVAVPAEELAVKSVCGVWSEGKVSVSRGQ